MQGGDLEKALSLYRRAVDVDAQSERARQGMREAERRLGRVERMLKEGYEFNVKEDYERAIEAWAGILKIAPSHAQAKKLITEARLRLGHMARQKEGGLSQAVQQWKEILKLDPEHRAAQALLEEDTALLSELNSLSGEAQDAFSRRKYRRAISCWRRMQDIDPANRKLPVMIEEAKKLARKRRRLRLAIAAAVVVVGGAGGQLAREFAALSAAERLRNEGRPGEAAIRIENALSHAVFLRSAMEQRRGRLRYLYYDKEARTRRAELRFDEALELYAKARAHASSQDIEAVESEIARTKIAQKLSAGRAAEDSGAWADACARHAEALEIARTSRLDRETREAENALEFARSVDEALRMEAEGRLEAAIARWRRARTLRPEHKAVREAVERLGIGP